MSAATATYRPTPISSSASGSLRQATLKKNMSITQTYYLAHKARAKLSKEAAQPDHDLRLLVGHANLLDSLMVELADAEREQERWFNQSVRSSTPKADSNRHIQWADSISEEAEEEYDSDSSDDSEDDYDEEEDIKMTPAIVRSVQVDEDMEEDDLEEDYAQLELVRTPSHSTSPPPELIDHDSESSEDEDSMPLSPKDSIVSLAPVKEEQEQEDSLFEDAYIVPARNPARLVTAISVY